MKKIYTILLAIISCFAHATDCSKLGNPMERLDCYDIMANQEKSNETIDPSIIIARKYIVENFKDPFSVNFRLEKKYTNVNLKDGEFTICGELNGKNSWGAYNGFKRYYYFNQEFIIENSKNEHVFGLLHSEVCKDVTENIDETLEKIRLSKDKNNSDTDSSANNIAGWVVNEYYDEMTDKHFWEGVSTTPLKIGGLKMFIKCDKKSPRIGVVSKNYLGLANQLQLTLIKLDDGDAYKEQWRLMSGNVLQKMDTDKKIAKLINKLSKSESITIRVWPYKESAITETFNTVGLDKVVERIKKECPRKLRYFD